MEQDELPPDLPVLDGSQAETAEYEQAQITPDTGSLPRRSGFGHWVMAAACSVVLAFIIHSFLLQTYRIPSASMVPTLHVGDHVLVNRLIYGIELGDRRFFTQQPPRRGDVVIFERRLDEASSRSTRFFVKRIAGLPGDLVQIKAHRLYLNGRSVDEGPEVRLGISEAAPGRNFGPLKLGTNQFFVLGDNRANSEDSRFFGPISFEQIRGRVFMVYWSWERTGAGFDIKWSRIGRKIQGGAEEPDKRVRGEDE